ncbi:MAG UNVERIFIED_CONTAM: hypothetical protein LVR18_10485 [Planctomycetaceae bacterium]
MTCSNEAAHRLNFLVEVGLDYLTLDRGMPTLSGGESQRIRLAGQAGRSLTGVLYVLDEPTIGLHPARQWSAACCSEAASRSGQHGAAG